MDRQSRRCIHRQYLQKERNITINHGINEVISFTCFEKIHFEFSWLILDFFCNRNKLTGSRSADISCLNCVPICVGADGVGDDVNSDTSKNRWDRSARIGDPSPTGQVGAGSRVVSSRGRCQRDDLNVAVGGDGGWDSHQGHVVAETRRLVVGVVDDVCARDSNLGGLCALDVVSAEDQLNEGSTGKLNKNRLDLCQIIYTVVSFFQKYNLGHFNHFLLHSYEK